MERCKLISMANTSTKLFKKCWSIMNSWKMKILLMRIWILTLKKRSIVSIVSIVTWATTSSISSKQDYSTKKSTRFQVSSKHWTSLSKHQSKIPMSGTTHQSKTSTQPSLKKAKTLSMRIQTSMDTSKQQSLMKATSTSCQSIWAR